MNKKIITLGIHGISFDFIYPFIKKGELENFEKIMNNGACGSIRTTLPPLHHTAWRAFLTGMMPERCTKNKTLLDIFEAENKKSVFINPPQVESTQYKNATILKRISPSKSDSGKEELFIYPESLRGDLKKSLDDFGIYIEKDFDSRKLSKIIKELFKSIDLQAKTVLHFIKNTKFDFISAVFEETDRLLHLLSAFYDRNHKEFADDISAEFKSVVYELFKKLDNHIGDILKAIDSDTTLFIISDFGVTFAERFVDINAWLMQNGFLKLKSSSAGKIGKDIFLDSGMKQDSPPTLSMSLINGENDYKKRFNALAARFISHDDIDWTQTRAFSTGDYGQIYINLLGNHPHGSVQHEDYGDTVSEIEAKLKTLLAPGSGRKIVDKIVIKDTGASITPDIMIYLENLQYYPFSSLDSKYAVSYQDVFSTFTSHYPKGLIMAIGSEIKKGAHINHAHIIDFVPTILYLFGMELPANIDGKVITEAINKSYLLDKKVLNKLKPSETSPILWGVINPCKN